MLLPLLLTIGAQFSGPIAVTPPEFSSAREPQVVIDDASNVYIAYGKDNELFLSVSEDGGRSYRAPTKIGEAGVLSLGMRRGPRLVLHKDTITVTATYGAQGKGRDGDIVAFRSADKGRTWNGEIRVNSVSGSAREGLHGMAVSKTGTVACSWLDLREQGTQLFFATSLDGGATWSENRLVYKSPSGTICECCHPSLAFDSKGLLHVLFRNALDGARDMYLTKSTDLRTFGPAQKLGQGTWKLNACPMDGGMIALGKSDGPMAVWRREGQLFMSSPTTPEAVLGEGKNPWMTMDKTGPIYVWNVGQSIVARLSGTTQTLASRGGDPVVASSPNGKLVIAAWNDGGIKSAILTRE